MKEKFRQCKTFAELHAAVGCGVEGYMTEVERDYLFELARQMKPGQRFLEIGVYGGTTLSVFALMGPDDLEIYGMDDWSAGEGEGPRSFRTGERIHLRQFCVEILEDNEAADRVRLLDGSSHALAGQFKLPLDLLIIDGDHSYQGALQDLVDYSPLVAPGGILIMDDYHICEDVRRATDDWFKGYPAVEWALIWGQNDPGQDVRPGHSKMLVFRRKEAA